VGGVVDRGAGLPPKGDAMRRLMPVLTLGLCAALLPSTSGAAGLDVRFGGFFPSTDSNLFRDDSSLYTVSKHDWQGFTGGVEGTFILARNVELGVHIDGYSRHVDTQYRDYERDQGAPIYQTLKLETVPMGMTLRFVPTSRNAKIAPYVGVGGDFVYWKYQEYGDFIDFQDPQLTIIPSSFEATGTTFGFHAVAGLRVALNEDISIVGEGKYMYAKEDHMGDDFPNIQSPALDLSGWYGTIGLHIRF
jgi:opacity protein-like surface antigen